MYLEYQQKSYTNDTGSDGGFYIPIPLSPPTSFYKSPSGTLCPHSSSGSPNYHVHPCFLVFQWPPSSLGFTFPPPTWYLHAHPSSCRLPRRQSVLPLWLTPPPPGQEPLFFLFSGGFLCVHMTYHTPIVNNYCQIIFTNNLTNLYPFPTQYRKLHLQNILRTERIQEENLWNILAVPPLSCQNSVLISILVELHTPCYLHHPSEELLSKNYPLSFTL